MQRPNPWGPGWITKKFLQHVLLKQNWCKTYQLVHSGLHLSLYGKVFDTLGNQISVKLSSQCPQGVGPILQCRERVRNIGRGAWGTAEEHNTHMGASYHDHLTHPPSTQRCSLTT